jgi:RNA polymerase sigma-70 factor, ECF subfamily
MISAEDLAAARPRLFALAYRMLGSAADADDAVQEGFLRWQRTARDDVREPLAWLMTAVTRIAIDRLRALQTERLRYEGPWLPEPIVGSAADDPALHAEQIDDLSVAFMHVLERLGPDERAAYLLHNAFGYRMTEVAQMLARPPATARQMVHRARERLRAERPRFALDRAAASRLVSRFVRAMENGDERELRAVFAADVTEVADGGGVIRAGINTVSGRDKVVRLMLGLRQKHWLHLRLEPASVSGRPGLVARGEDGSPYAIVALETDETAITALHIILEPGKVARAMAGLDKASPRG